MACVPILVYFIFITLQSGFTKIMIFNFSLIYRKDVRKIFLNFKAAVFGKFPKILVFLNYKEILWFLTTRFEF